MRILFFFAMTLSGFHSHAERLINIDGSRVNQFLNMRPVPSGDNSISPPLCKLNKFADGKTSGDLHPPVRATDWKVVNNRVWCKIPFSQSQGCEPKYKDPNSGLDITEGWVAGWLMEDPYVDPVYDSPSIESIVLEDATAHCDCDLKTKIEGGLRDIVPKGISFGPPVKMIKCANREKLPGVCNCRGVASKVGWRTLQGETRYHRGIDITAPRGTPLYAAADGIISAKGTVRGYGKQIEITHFDENRPKDKQLIKNASGDVVDVKSGQTINVTHCGVTKPVVVDSVTTSFNHMKSYAPGIEPGAVVKKGQLIGYINDTGRSFADHLHYEIDIEPSGEEGAFQCPYMKANEATGSRGAKGRCYWDGFHDFPERQPKYSKNYLCEEAEQ